jgi:PsbP-like protein
MYRRYGCNLKYHQAKKIIFVFLVLSVISSLSAVAFVTGNNNVNLAFAAKKDGGSSGGGGGGSEGGSKNNKGTDGGGGDNGGGGGTTTTEGSDNTNAGSGTTPPPSTDENTPPPPEDQKTCPDGSNPDESGNCPQAANQKTCPDGSTPDESGNCPTTTPTPCPDGSTPDPTTGTCPTTTQQNTAPQTLTQQTTCPGGAVPDATTGNCPTTTNTPSLPGPLSLKPPCPGGAARDANNLCPTSTTTTNTHILYNTPITCENDKHPLEGKCVSSQYPNDDGTCMKGTHASHTSSAYLGVICTSDIVPYKDSLGNPALCPRLSHLDSDHNCLLDSSSPIQFCPQPGTPILFQGKCYDHLPVIGGSTTGKSGGFIQMFPTKPDGSIGSSGPVAVYVPANKDGSCTPGDDRASGGYCRHKVQSTGGTGGGGTGGTTTGTTTTTTPPKPTTQTGTTGTGGTTTTTTGNPTTTTTPSTSTTTTNVIRGGGSSAGGGGAASGGSSSGGGTSTAAPGQGANTFLIYVNAVNKITIKYPSAWTKTELVDNPSIPVMFNAPTTIATTAGAAKTSFVISITPSAANLDSFTQQQINGLTQSNTVKYTITDSNAKLLTPPNGITAFREISYDGIKTGNNIPLKGAAIFFVNGGTGYSLLYLAKQTEYSQNLPIVQQMVNSFQVGTSGGPVQNVAAANSSPR